MLGAAALLAAALLVALMGYAIQRGATCTVVAVREIVERRRATRLAALVEAALWVSGGLLVAHALGASMATPLDHRLTLGAVAGGALLGLGAWLAGACVFGAVARLGSGEWAFAAVPAGFFAGCLLAARLGWLMPPMALGAASPFAAAPSWRAPRVLGAAVLRAALFVLSGRWRHDAGQRSLWHPHAATIVIALAFVFVLFFAGPWAYTDLLAGLAAGRADSAAPQLLLFAALIAGAMLGGWRAGRLALRMPEPAAVLRCFAGGALMALGGLLVPGSNDALVLLGLPNLHLYAWVAFAAMVTAIGAALALEQALQARTSVTKL